MAAASLEGQVFQQKLVHHKLTTVVDQLNGAIYDLRNNPNDAEVVIGLQQALVAAQGALAILGTKLQGKDLSLADGNPDIVR